MKIAEAGHPAYAAAQLHGVQSISVAIAAERLFVANGATEPETAGPVREQGHSGDERTASVARRRAQTMNTGVAVIGDPLWLRLGLSAGALGILLGIAHSVAPGTLPLAMLVVFAAAAVSSIAGFAFSAVCGAMLFHLLDPVSAVQLMIVCSVAIQAFSVAALRNSIDWRLLSRFLLGGIVSLPLGIYLLLTLNAHLYGRVIGVFLIAYGVFMLVRPDTTLRYQRIWADVAVGAVGGITGGFAGFPGAFVTVWCGLKGWDKGRQRGVYQPYILIMQLLNLGALQLVTKGSHGHAATIELLGCVPAAALGTWCGLGFYRSLSTNQFRIVVNGLLVIAGLGLLL